MTCPSDVVRTEDLNHITGKRVGGEPATEAEHYYTCEACGQAVDMRRLGEVFHHEESDHKPLERQ